MDAFQRQLKRFDIRVRGAGSDAVEKFFHTSESAVLFPEYVSRSGARRAWRRTTVLPAITATVTNFDGMDYRSIASVPTEEDKALRRVEEGAEIPATADQAPRRIWCGCTSAAGMLVASYEAIRFQRLDLFSVTLRQIGATIGACIWRTPSTCILKRRRQRQRRPGLRRRHRAHRRHQGDAELRRSCWTSGASSTPTP
jgi:hypothetical protein